MSATLREIGNGRVILTVPNINVCADAQHVSITVDRPAADELRAKLNAVLPAARERDLMLDPTIRDIDVLRAAQAIATEHQCPGVVKQLDNMIELYCHEDAQLEDGRQLLSELRDMTPAERDGGEQRDNPWKLHLLTIMGDVEPVLSGPFVDERDRVEAAQDYRRAHGDEDGLYRIDATGDVKVDTFTGNELSAHPRRCTLCGCDATDERHGFAVCAYHVDHGEDDPPCPTCEAPDAEAMGDRKIAADERDAPAPVVDERETVVDVGDRVYDAPDGKWREVVRIDHAEGTVYMADGGCMGLRECMRSEIRLPSEALD